MIPTLGEDDWDFEPVFDLIRSLSISGGEHAYQKKPSNGIYFDQPEQVTCTAAFQVENAEKGRLGDFDKIWQYLDHPLDLPPPTFATGPLPAFVDVWDGQTANQQRTLKVVRWQDNVESANLADSDEKICNKNSSILDLSNLTKQQRKKARRKQRQAERAALVAQATNENLPPSGSEDESEKDVQEHKIPDRSGVIYQLLHGTAPPIGTGRLRSGKLFRSQDPNEAGALPAGASPSASQVLQILKPVKENALEVAAAKKKTLMSMLNEIFIDDRQYLSNLSFAHNLANSTVAAAEGIHIFVDASNVCCHNPICHYLAATNKPNR